MLRGGKRSLQEPLTPKRQHQARSPSHEKQPPSLQRGGRQRRQRPPGLPEKRAYACLSCSNAQGDARGQNPKTGCKESGPADGQGHSRLQEKILPTIISTLALQMEPKGRRTNAKSMRVKNAPSNGQRNLWLGAKLPFTILQQNLDMNL
ncbi:hypothetical protein AAY473_016776 [Plecturocebus cupreus]